VDLRTLRATDETTVKGWLRPYLSEHLAWWAAAYGAAPRYPLGTLIDREWGDLLAASHTPERFVRVVQETVPGAFQNARPLGVVYASLREDRYLGIPVGVLSWLYVAEAARGQGVSSVLMQAADGWMAAQGAEGREVFVTAVNTPALKLYEHFGYRVVDARMLGPAPRPGG
jgi:GNAT superfamily N-acetyltransferase